MSEPVMSEIKKGHIHKLLSTGKRVDGRALDEYRKISIETNYIESAQGSARVRLGNTDVLVGVKMIVGAPFADTPDRGVLTTNTELIPLASPTFEAGPPDAGAIELARVIDSGIRESEMINLREAVHQARRRGLDQLPRHLCPGLRRQPVRCLFPGRHRRAQDHHRPGQGDRQGRGLSSAAPPPAHSDHCRKDRKLYIV